MEKERFINRAIWGTTVLLFILAVILEFKVDKIIIQNWSGWMKGHRDFAINFSLGGFASGAITGITTWIAFKNKRKDTEEKINRHLYDVQRSFEGYCDSILQKNYPLLVSYMENFENAMTDFINCLHSNDCEEKKYRDIEKIYCEKIIQHSTIIMTYDCISNNDNEGDMMLLFSDLSNELLSHTKADFDKALSKVIWTNDSAKGSLTDEVIGQHIGGIRRRYFEKKEE